MKLKLDENLGERGAKLFRAEKYDVATVAEQGRRPRVDCGMPSRAPMPDHTRSGFQQSPSLSTFGLRRRSGFTLASEAEGGRSLGLLSHADQRLGEA